MVWNGNSQWLAEAQERDGGCAEAPGGEHCEAEAESGREGSAGDVARRGRGQEPERGLGDEGGGRRLRGSGAGEISEPSCGRVGWGGRPTSDRWPGTSGGTGRAVRAG